MKSSNTWKYAAAALAALGAAAAARFAAVRRRSRGASTLATVDHVDLARYMGKWYEIARYPVAFEQDCYAATAEYTLRPDGKVLVLNACRKGSVDGSLQASEGVATVSDTRSNARLKVEFFWPFSGDYWIIDLDRDYRYAVVSNPDRTALWVLSRTPVMDDAIYDGIVRRLPAKGFDIAKLRKIPQVKEEVAGAAG